MSKQLDSFTDPRRMKFGGDGAKLLLPNTDNALVLPNKAFTPDEVQAMSGLSGTILDQLTKDGVLPLVRLDVGEPGYTYMQAFAAFVARKWLDEGAGMDRVRPVTNFVANTQKEHMLLEFGRGNSFVAIVEVPSKVIGAPPQRRGVMVRTDRQVPLMVRLDLATHFDEFLTQVDRVFPPKIIV